MLPLLCNSYPALQYFRSSLLEFFSVDTELCSTDLLNSMVLACLNYTFVCEIYVRLSHSSIHPFLTFDKKSFRSK